MPRLDGDETARSPGVASQARRPASRPRSRPRVSNSNDEDEYIVNKRSSWLITQREPLPEIPARFLEHFRDSRPKLEQAHSSQALSEADPPLRKGSRPASLRSVSTSRIQPTTTLATTSKSALRDHYNYYDAEGSDVASRGSRNGIATERAARPTTQSASSSPRARRSFSSVSTTVPRSPKRKLSKDAATLAALTGGNATMAHTADPTADDDLFLQLAEDATERAPTRSSWHGKRRSHADTLPSSPDDRRPRTSGQITGRPSSRIGVSRLDMHRVSEQRYKTPRAESVVSFRQDDAAGLSGRSRAGRPSRFSTADQDRSPMSPSRLAEAVRSPELPTFGRRRPSFGAPSVKAHVHRQSQLAAQPQGSEGESPADSSEPKRSAPESESVESNTAQSTVWDELDDLKSRIKKLELTGKMPSTSSAAVAASIEQSERPRTATTAPTTIESSPKQERKTNAEVKAAAEKREQQQQQTQPSSPSMASIHPTLHAALAKAKTLLNASLYRTLEATANDALQLVALTGSAGPQGTTFSAASIINGVTVSDRHVRRKADMMCRNLTDLCLALCEGKHETSSVLASPIAIDSAPRPKPPTSRYARASIGYGEDTNGGASGPMSRLEARRSSILGIQPSNSSLNSPLASADDVSASEHETTPSHVPQQHESRRFGRAGSRLAAPRISRYDEASGDEDPTVRPLSRAMTDIGSHRQSQHRSPRDYSSASTLKRPDRSPSLRDSLAARRANATSHETNRVSSLTVDPNRRRFLRESTPPVLEEDSEYSPASQQSQPRRRIMSSGASASSGNQYSSRRAVELAASRSASLSQRRREMVVE